MVEIFGKLSIEHSRHCTGVCNHSEQRAIDEGEENIDGS